MKWRRVFKLGLILAMVSVLMTGCDGEALSSYIKTDLGASLQARFQENVNLTNKLYSVGIIDLETRDSIVSHINKQASEYYKLDKSSNTYTDVVTVDNNNGDYKSGEVVRSVSAYWVYNGSSLIDRNLIFDDATAVSGTESASSFGLRLVGNWYHQHYIRAKGVGSTLKNGGYNLDIDSLPIGTEPAYIERNDTNENTVVPIRIIDKDMLNFSIGTDITVYVLKDSISTSVDGQNSIDSLIALLSSDSSYENGKLKSDIAKAYFEQAVDSSTGEKVTLGNLFDFQDLIKVSDSYSGDNIPASKYGSGNRPGYDMLIKQEGLNSLKIKLEEYNADEVNRVCSILGMDSITGDSTSKWIYGTNNDIYLMEYPVYYISGLKSTDNNVELELSESQMNINLYTGKTIYVNGTERHVMSRGDDEYITLGDTSIRNSTSSFILSGKCSTSVTLSIDNENSNTADIKVGRVVLRDYLETVYCPGIISDTNLVVFGRKIRFNKISADGDKAYISKVDPVAIYVDKEGNQLGSSTLTSADFCSIRILNDSNKVFRLAYSGEKVGQVVRGSSLNEYSSQSLETTVVNRVGVVSIPFPCNDLGANADKKSMETVSENGETKQLFYAIGVNGDVFSTGLYSSWINSEKEENSLLWWNDWLYKHGFSYSVDYNNVDSVISNNFSYEVSSNGIVQLDLKVIAKIQNEMSNKQIKKENRAIRTFFKILGYAMIVYAIILMGGWIIDTNLDTGIDLTGKLTFGKRVAYHSSEDIEFEQEDKKSMTMINMIVDCLVIIAFGLLLVLTDVFVFINGILGIFAGLTKYLESFI